MRVVRRQHEQGDTLIEVLLALSVFGIVVVGAFSIMQKGAAQMYDDLERTQVRMLIDQQIESLIYARDQQLLKRTAEGAAQVQANPAHAAAAQVWADISRVDERAPTADACGVDVAHTFFIVSENGVLKLKRLTSGTPATASGFPAPGTGLLVYYQNSPVTNPVKYKDFYIKACWEPTSSRVTSVVSSVVRLYE